MIYKNDWVLENLRQLAELNIDSITNTSLHALYKIEIRNYKHERWVMDTDGILHNRFMHT